MLSAFITNAFAALVAHYPFNGNAVDETGKGYDGQLINVSLAEDRFRQPRKAYRFDGMGYINIEMPFEEDFAKGMTISLWVNPSESKTALLFHTPEVGLLINDDDSLWFFSVTAVAAITLNEWQHLVATIDSFGNVDLYKNGLPIKGGSSNFISPNEEGITLGGSFVGILDDIRIYSSALSEAEVVKLYKKEKPPSTLTPKKRTGTYQEGYQAGRRACINNPQSCGLSYPSDELDEQDDEQENDEEGEEEEVAQDTCGDDFESGNREPNTAHFLSSSNVILSIPLAAIGDSHSIGAELVRDVDPRTGEVIFRLKSSQDKKPTLEQPQVWEVKVNPTTVQVGDAQLVSWQSRHQGWYYFYLYHVDDTPINTHAFLSETCQAAGSNGSDGCLGWQNSSERQSDSWMIPAQLTAGEYKIKVVIWHTANQPAQESYSLPFIID